MTVQALRRFSRQVNLNTHYTFSKSIDETTDVNFLPNNSLNPRADRGLATFDQRHRFVGSAVIDIPHIFSLSPIITATSGRPFQTATGFGALIPFQAEVAEIRGVVS